MSRSNKEVERDNLLLQHQTMLKVEGDTSVHVSCYLMDMLEFKCSNHEEVHLRATLVVECARNKDAEMHILMEAASCNRPLLDPLGHDDQ